MEHGVAFRPADGSAAANRDEAMAASLAGLEKLHLIMGLQCNVRCTMCYQTDFSAKANMPASLYVDRLAAVYPHVRIVKLQGGEPTVMRNCREVATIVREYPWVRISMSTNGVRLDGFWGEVLARQGGEIDVSLNAATEPSYRQIVRGGTFDRVVNNLRALAAARQNGWPRLGISLVILKENFAELAAFVRLASELGLDSVKYAIDPVLSFRGLPRAEEVVAELERVERARLEGRMEVSGLESLRRRFHLPAPASPAPVAHRHCRLPFTQVIVDAQGEVRPCVATWVSLGNLREATLPEIWNGPRAQAFRQRIDGNDYRNCDPYCPLNQNPSRVALLRKYATYATQDPTFFTRKLRRKVEQLRRKPVPLAPTLAGAARPARPTEADPPRPAHPTPTPEERNGTAA